MKMNEKQMLPSGVYQVATVTPSRVCSGTTVKHICHTVHFCMCPSRDMYIKSVHIRVSHIFNINEKGGGNDNKIKNKK
jgi:hypothetical protein